LSVNHEKVKQNLQLHQAQNTFQNAGGEFAADAIAVAQAEAEAADTPTSVPESVGEVGEEGDAQKNEEKEEEAEGAEEDAGEEKEKEVAEVKAREVGAAPGRPQRDGAGVRDKRFSHSQFVPPKVVKPVPQSGKKS
jgi:hypothetical protein